MNPFTRWSLIMRKRWHAILIIVGVLVVGMLAFHESRGTLYAWGLLKQYDDQVMVNEDESFQFHYQPAPPDPSGVGQSYQAQINYRFANGKQVYVTYLPLDSRRERIRKADIVVSPDSAEHTRIVTIKKTYRLKIDIYAQTISFMPGT